MSQGKIPLFRKLAFMFVGVIAFSYAIPTLWATWYMVIGVPGWWSSQESTAALWNLP